MLKDNYITQLQIQNKTKRQEIKIEKRNEKEH